MLEKLTFSIEYIHTYMYIYIYHDIFYKMSSYECYWNLIIVFFNPKFQLDWEDNNMLEINNRKIINYVFC